jgi:glycosyltransferase involved in cell wall biosynthesis
MNERQMKTPDRQDMPLPTPSASDTGHRFSMVIPVFNHPLKVRETVLAARKLGYPVFVVDDGSTDGTGDQIRDIADIRILRHPENRGKGAALRTGFAEAVLISDWAVTLDADGQHDPEDARRLIAAVRGKTRPIVVGMREGMAGKEVPWTSRFGRKFSNFWVWTAGGPRISDTQSGFRLYPLPEALNLNVRARRFQFEVEVLVKARWAAIPVIEAPVGVNYRPGTRRISHFRPFVDFLRNSAAFSRLILQRILIPAAVRKTWAGRR